jgi:hypothetical protein
MKALFVLKLDHKVIVIHLAWICKMTSECNKYAFLTLSEVVIRDLQVVIRDLQVVIRDLQKKCLDYKISN